MSLNGAVRSRLRISRTDLLEFFLVGGATLFLLPLAWLLRHAIGLDSAELAVGFVAFHAAFIINDPHFAVTYLLFYKGAKNRALGGAYRPMQRARYLFAGFVAPLALLVWAAAAIRAQSALSLGLMIQLMFFLVGWHYVKQGFGVLIVLSARRQFHFSRLERNVILAHCLTGWLYARASPFDPGKEVSEKGIVYTTLAHPEGLELCTGLAFTVSTVALGWILLRRWRSDQQRPPLVPLGGLLITVWLWTVFSSLDPLLVYVIPALHSVQYLYFVWLLKRNEALEGEGPPLFQGPVRLRLGLLAASAVALGWMLLHGAPSFLDEAFVLAPLGDEEPGSLGPTPYFAIFFTFVNLHHYLMDSVIWRRENPDTRYLRA